MKYRDKQASISCTSYDTEEYLGPQLCFKAAVGQLSSFSQLP